MTTVSSEHTRRRYEWIVPVPYVRGAVVGDVQNAMAMAANVYKTVTGGSTSYDDWLRVSVTDESVVFWFEVDEQPGVERSMRRGLQSLISVLEEGQQRTWQDPAGPALIEQLKAILRGDSGGAA